MKNRLLKKKMPPFPSQDEIALIAESLELNLHAGDLPPSERRFIESLVDFHKRTGQFTEKQYNIGVKMLARLIADKRDAGAAENRPFSS